MTKSNKANTPDTRQQILNTAQQIILGKGFSAVGLNEILKTANVPKGSFYHYFESKEQFGCALLEHYFEQYLQSLNAQLQINEHAAIERLFAYFERWRMTQCDDTSTDRCLVVKLSGEVTDLSENMRLSLKQGTQQIIELLSSCIQEAIDNHEIVTDFDAKELAEELYYLWLGATLITKVNHTSSALDLAMNLTRTKLAINTTR